MRAQNDDSGSALVHNSDHVRDTAQAEPAPMTIGTSLVLIAARAILKYAVTVDVPESTCRSWA
jgi:hypothetical protein